MIGPTSRPREHVRPRARHAAPPPGRHRATPPPQAGVDGRTARGGLAALVGLVLLAVGVASTASGSTPPAPTGRVFLTAAGMPDDWAPLPRARQAAAISVAAPPAAPPAAAPSPVGSPGTPAAAFDLRMDAGGIPARVLAAYRNAESVLAVERPGCRLPWWLLAGIGRVESAHGSVGGAWVDADGRVRPEILGVRLDGVGPVSEVRDTDDGAHDRDTEFDRAIGPLQFLPGTWSQYAVDADLDGRADPHDIDDAALAAGRYLCSSGGSLGEPAAIVRAVYAYNHSYDYVRQVLAVAAAYAGTGPVRLGSDLLPASAAPAAAGDLAELPSAGPVGSAARTAATPSVYVPVPASTPPPTATPRPAPSPSPAPDPTASEPAPPASAPEAASSDSSPSPTSPSPTSPSPTSPAPVPSVPVTGG